MRQYQEMPVVPGLSDTELMVTASEHVRQHSSQSRDYDTDSGTSERK